MPPASFTPRCWPVIAAKSRTACSITNATGPVAAGLILPVEVLMKSPPASRASQLARRTLSNVTNSPVSRMTFRCAVPHACFTATISSNTSPRWPDRKAPRSITMSISSAPAATASATSISLVRNAARPDGNAVATLATATALPRTACTAVATRSGYTQTAATAGVDGSPGSGRIAFAHRDRTVSGVSLPSSVVRSTMPIAASMAQALAEDLMLRVANMATRASAPT